MALSTVTDEFIGFIKASGDAWDLEQTSQFIVVAATLLDLKAARLLPSGEMTDTEDLALLEARDLLFARLLQYKAYKQIAALLVQRLTVEDRRHPRQVGPDPRFASLLPEIRLTITPAELAALAAKAMAPKQADVISLAHLHTSTVSVREQAALVIDRLRRAGTLTFRALASDAADRVTTVARFLALLELFREQAVAFEQLTPLGELTIRWTGSASGELEISDEFDEDARRHRPSRRTRRWPEPPPALTTRQRRDQHERAEREDSPSCRTRWRPEPPPTPTTRSHERPRRSAARWRRCC